MPDDHADGGVDVPGLRLREISLLEDNALQVLLEAMAPLSVLFNQHLRLRPMPIQHESSNAR